MILYNLHCAGCGHEFEGWFRNSEAFDGQVEAGALACTECGSSAIEKAIMAPRLARTRTEPASSPGAEPGKAVVMAKKVREAMGQLRRAVEESCDYVGDKFPEEARRIHYGESEERGIYGEATSEEHESMRDEGIEVHRIPWVDRTEH
jgi:hypothetical protein